MFKILLRENYIDLLIYIDDITANFDDVCTQLQTKIDNESEITKKLGNERYHRKQKERTIAAKNTEIKKLKNEIARAKEDRFELLRAKDEHIERLTNICDQKDDQLVDMAKQIEALQKELEKSHNARTLIHLETENKELESDNRELKNRLSQAQEYIRQVIHSKEVDK